MFRWTEVYSVKVQVLDDQHKRLFSLANELHEFMSMGKSREVIIPILNELMAYTREHFAAEEVLMAAFAYPGLVNHRMEHEKLTKRVRDYIRDVQAGDMDLSIELMDFLQNWLSHHVLETDKKYSQFMVDRGAV
jgi:hemerythrin-like metal-binding protein